MTEMQNDLKMSKIALGTWAWGEADGAAQVFGNSFNVDDLKPVFEKATELGLNLWDTAAAYTNGQSEKILGQFVKDSDRSKLLLSTKFTPQMADDTDKAIENMFNGSIKRLQTDYVDIYWIHNSADVEKWTKEIISLAKTDKVKYIGVSNHNLAQIKRANEILHSAGLKISAVQNHFSLLDRTSETSGILEYCRDNDITFFSYMVLEQGALSGKYDASHPFPEGSERAKVYNGKLAQLGSLIDGMKVIATEHKVDVSQIATAWAVAKGTVPIIGATKVKHIEDAAKAAEVKLNITEVNQLDKLGDETAVETTREWEQSLK